MKPSQEETCEQTLENWTNNVGPFKTQRALGVDFKITVNDTMK